MVSITESEKDNARDAVVAIWPPQWYFGTAIAYSLLMVWLPLVVSYGMMIYSFFMNDLSPAQRRICYFALVCCPIWIFFGVKFEREKWRVLWKPSVSIFSDRIIVNGNWLPWEGIRSCHWSAYLRRTLVIQVARNGTYGRMSVPIPDDRCAEIEEIFSAFSKWDRPVRSEAVGQESDADIKLGA